MDTKVTITLIVLFIAVVAVASEWSERNLRQMRRKADADFKAYDNYLDELKMLMWLRSIPDGKTQHKVFENCFVTATRSNDMSKNAASVKAWEQD